MVDAQREYRDHLVSARHNSQEAYDKALLSLSGGALGLSMAFLDGIAGQAAVRAEFLLTSWVLWALSLLLVLLSHFSSHHALSRALMILDAELDDDPTKTLAARLTRCCNVVGGLAFVAGVCFIVAFAYINLRS